MEVSLVQTVDMIPTMGVRVPFNEPLLIGHQSEEIVKNDEGWFGSGYY
jgi:hypothetical protein